jgi:hypothetical protein
MDITGVSFKAWTVEVGSVRTKWHVGAQQHHRTTVLTTFRPYKAKCNSRIHRDGVHSLPCAKVIHDNKIHNFQTSMTESNL